MDQIPTIQSLTPEALGGATGAIIALVFRFFPVVRQWFNTHDPDTKASIVAFATLIVAGGIGVYNMAGTGFNQASLVTLALTVATAVGANGGTYNWIKERPAQ